MGSIVQYDLFEEVDPTEERFKAIENSLDRYRKRLFAGDADIMKVVVKQQKEIDALNARLDRLTNKMTKEVK